MHYWNDGYSLLRVAGRENIYYIDTTANSYNLIKVMSLQKIINVYQVMHVSGVGKSGPWDH